MSRQLTTASWGPMPLIVALVLMPLSVGAQGPPFGDPPGDVVPQLVITGAELFAGPNYYLPCENPCDGILLVSGRNLGDVEPFAGTVQLFLPTMGEQALTVVSFDPVAQQLTAELPVGTLLPGTFLLTVSTGSSSAKTDVFDVALEVTGVVAGPGLTGGGKAGELNLGVNFQGSGVVAAAARSDHKHQGEDIVSGTVAETVVDAGLARDTEIIPDIVKPYIDNLFAGSVAAFATEEPPPGWLECNGEAVSRTTYARLFERIGTAFGAGDGETTFNLPDLRGQFIRGWDHERKYDPDRDRRVNQYLGGAIGDHVGSMQDDLGRFHSHTWQASSDNTSNVTHNHTVHLTHGYHDPNPFVHRREGLLLGMVRVDLSRPLGTYGNTHSHTFQPSGSVGLSGGSESRPKNIYLMFCIKY